MIKRITEGSIREALAKKKAITLMGARQVGKSIRQIITYSLFTEYDTHNNPHNRRTLHH